MSTLSADLERVMVARHTLSMSGTSGRDLTQVLHARLGDKAMDHIVGPLQ